MKSPERIVNAILEADDEDTVKDILGADYPEKPEGNKPGEVERFDRWADIKIGDKNFCISYLTPVAIYVPGEGIRVTDRNWSGSTKRHIVKWANHIGMQYRNYAELETRCHSMPQADLLRVFKEEAQQVKWSKRQARTAERVPDTATGLHSDRDERIDIRPHND